MELINMNTSFLISITIHSLFYTQNYFLRLKEVRILYSVFFN